MGSFISKLFFLLRFEGKFYKLVFLEQVFLHKEQLT